MICMHRNHFELVQSKIFHYAGWFINAINITLQQMTHILNIINIKQLVQVNRPGIVKGKEMSSLPTIVNAFLKIENGIIADFGEMKNFQSDHEEKIIDATGKMVFPCWCDSHTHLVYAGSREGEFMDRIRGLSYEEIAKRGGGILNSAQRLHNASEEELFTNAMKRLDEIMQQGTGAAEIKSGYGLSVEDELKMLRVIKKLKEHSPLTIKATFLGAHAIPKEYQESRHKYIDLIIEEMMPRIAEEKLADYCDVFCERNYFTKEETVQILKAGLKHGLKPKVHANQLSNSGGVQAGVECGAISVDHLEYIGEEEINVLKNSNTMPTILPGAQFFLGLPFPPARTMIDAGLPLAIASDYNPGSSPSGNMNLMTSFSCIQYKMTPEEVVNAATINSAYAMDVLTDLGSIDKGKKANVFITKEILSIAYLPYSFGSNLIATVIINGEIVYEN